MQISLEKLEQIITKHFTPQEIESQRFEEFLEEIKGVDYEN